MRYLFSFVGGIYKCTNSSSNNSKLLSKNKLRAEFAEKLMSIHNKLNMGMTNMTLVFHQVAPLARKNVEKRQKW
jgi:hypothetical protein